MTKDMTPMKRYTSNMQELRSQLKPFFKEITLNKSEPKYNYVRGESNYSAGVENDFILIFSEKNKKVSFALAFTYIGLDVSQQTVQASVKSGESNEGIISSENMTLEVFKNKINYFNKWLAENNEKHAKSYNSSLGIIEKFSETFLDKVLDIKKEIEKKEKEIEEFIKEKSKDLNIPHLTEKSLKANHSFDSAHKLIKKQMESCSEFKELKLIEKRAKELKEFLTVKQDNLEKDNNIKLLFDDKHKSGMNLNKAVYELEKSVQDELKKSNKVIAKKIKPKY